MSRRARSTVTLIISVLAACALASFAVAQEPEASSDPAAASTTPEAAAQTEETPAPADQGEIAQEEPAQGDVDLEEDEDALDQEDAAATDDETGGDESGDSAQADDEDRSCEDFTSQEEAQEYFTDQGGDATHNVDNLDADGDGQACEALDAPAGGVDAGGGGTAPPPPTDGDGPLAFILGGAALGLALGAFSVAGRRRRSTT